MMNNTSKTTTKRLPKGQRTYVRRLKQAARKEVTIKNPKFNPETPVQATKKQNES